MQISFADRLHITYPVIQAPMLGVVTPQMVAEVSNAGCLGSLPLGYTNKETASQLIGQTKALTNKPFAVNVFSYESPQHIALQNTSKIEAIYAEYNVAFFDSIPTKDPYPSYKELIDMFIEEEIPLVSFHFGLPDADVIQKLKRHNILTLASATCIEEALVIEQSGIDMVVAQGIEAGGNRGTFLKGELPQVGLMSLLTQVVDRVRIPVIAAGGIFNTAAIRACIDMGATAVQIGSLFLRCNESGASQSYKDALAESTDTSTIVTNLWSGRYGRCLKNRFIEKMMGADAFEYPVQHYITTKLRQFGKQQDNADIQALWAGQSARYAEEKPIREILISLTDSL